LKNRQQICYDYIADSGKFYTMSNSPPGRLCQLITMAVIFVVGLTACGPDTRSPDPIAYYTFSQLVPNEPVGFQLDQSDQPILLIRVEGYETAFESRVLAGDGQELSVARLPYLRAGLVFHVLELDPDDGPLTVSINPVHVTSNSLINIRIFALTGESRRDAARTRAFESYTQAIQSTDDESPETWTERVAYLRSAAAGFERSGDLEEELWANFLEAYFHYFPLADYQAAIAQAQQVQGRARHTGHRLIELMALQLEGQALIERQHEDAPGAARVKQVQAQTVLEQAAILAGELDMSFEQAWAVNTRGMGYYYQDQYAQAEGHYREALEISQSLGDEYLHRMISGNLALVRERLGDLGGALSTLQDINRQLEISGSRGELAHNWSELGRLYQRLFLFPQSIDAQGRALQLWRELDSAEGVGRSRSSLAHAYHALGNSDTALSILLEATGEMEAANYGRGLRDGFGLMANIYRAKGQFELMEGARIRQERYLTSTVHHARFQYDKGLDALVQYPHEPAGAESHFARAEQVAIETNDIGLQLRSRLQRCAHSTGPEAVSCDGPDLQKALQEWLPRAPPSQEFEARFLLARTDMNRGRAARAIDRMNGLIDDIQQYRHSLPGVLGAWYWESRARVFKTYMSFNLDLPQTEQRAAQSLLALNRLLNTSRSPTKLSPHGTPLDLEPGRELRVLLAQLQAGSPEDHSNTRQAIDRELIALNAGHRLEASSMEQGQLDEWLEGMTSGSALLAYFFADNGAWAWQADRSGVRLTRLADSDIAATSLGMAFESLRIVGNNSGEAKLDAAGELLIAPIAQSIPRTVYLLAVGEMAGFPFEALRHDGRYFGQHHDVVNIMSLEGLRNQQGGDADARSWRQVLLAGDPVGVEMKLPRAAEEIHSISRLFDGMEIRQLTLENLNPGLLRDGFYTEADLFHFASHGDINLEYPELSRLMLSGDEETGESVYLTPLDIGRIPITADLVVLSACSTTGVNSFSFDSNLGFVSEYLQAGAGAVVASLWPVSDHFAREFMQDFYTSLLQGKSAPRALAAAKRRHYAGEETTANLEWPSFQIYVR